MAVTLSVPQWWIALPPQVVDRIRSKGRIEVPWTYQTQTIWPSISSLAAVESSSATISKTIRSLPPPRR